MREVDLIHRQVELIAASIGARVRRLQDALHDLSFLTRKLFRGAQVEPGAVAAWLDGERFEVLETGFYEQRDRVERARAQGKLEGELTCAWGALSKDVPGVAEHLYLLRDLSPMLQQIHGRLEGVAWIYYQDALSPHATLVYPGLAPDGIIPSDFDWFAYHSFSIVAPAVNPERTIRWSPPNVDYGGQGLISCISIPLWEADTFLGVWTLDVRLADLHRGLAVDVGHLGRRQKNLLVDYEGRLMAHPDMDVAANEEKGSVHSVLLASLGGGFAELDVGALVSSGHGKLEVVDATGERLLVVYRVVPEIRWIVLTALPAADLIEATQAAFESAFTRLGSGDLSFRLDAVGDDAMRAMVQSYNEMAETLQESLKKREVAEAEARKLALEQERLGRELEIAATIQLAMLPRAPRHPGFEFAGCMRPAHEVGGDFYDVLTRPGADPLWITIGDVSSHGLGSGLVMMIAQAAFQAVFEANPGLPADEVLRRVNRIVHTNATTRLGSRHYLTGQLLMHRGAGVFDCVGAHLWPLVIDPAKREARRVEVVGPWIGVLPELPTVPVSRLELRTGEVLCLYSDGLTEARDRDGQMYDLDRLTQAAIDRLAAGAPLDAVAAGILSDVESFAPEQDDDRTLLLVRRTGT